MGVRHFSCENLALAELRAELIDAQRENAFVVLVGQNNNILGVGRVDEVNDATVELELEDTVGVMAQAVQQNTLLLPEIDFTVSLCNVASIIETDELSLGLLLVLAILGLIDLGTILRA